MTWILACLVGSTVVAGGFIVLVVRTVRVQARTRSWPSVPGQVTASTVRHHPGDWESRDWYEPLVEYRYRIDDREYQSSRVRFSRMSFLNRDEAEAVIGLYPAGAEVPVYVDPGKPQRAVLDNTPERTGTWIIAGVLTVAVYCAAVVSLWSML